MKTLKTIISKVEHLSIFPSGEMRGEAAPYSLVPSTEISLLEEREGGRERGKEHQIELKRR